MSSSGARVALEIIVPAYNESQRIERTLHSINEYYCAQEYTWRCTVIDDGSSDDTCAIVTRISLIHSNISSVRYEQNRGKGFAVRFGMLRANADRLLFCDADLATPQEETAKLWAALDGGADVAIGSRPMSESNLEIRQPWYREFLGRAFNKAVQLFGIKGIDDTQCGFKMFTAPVAREVFGRCKLDGFGFDFESLMIARDLGYRIDEIPIRWSHQEGSKVVLMRDGPRMLRDLVKLRCMGKRSRLAVNRELES